jgi:thiamine kinase-like enzyme
LKELRFFTDKEKTKNKYLALLNKNNPRIIVPLRNYKLFINGLKIQNTASFKKRIIKKSLIIGYAFFKSIYNNIVYNTTELEELINITKKEIKDNRIFDVSVYVGTAKSKNRKLTFLLMDEFGYNLGILKYPIEKDSRLFIENEFNSLKKIKEFNFNSINFPNEAKLFDFETNKVLYQENIFINTKQLRNELNEIIVNAAIELALKTKGKNIYNYFNKIFNNIGNIKEMNKFKETYKILSVELLNLGFPLIYIHGDFALYNMQSDGERLHLIDWEYFRDGLPLFDLFHFVFQGKYQIEKKSVHKCIRDIFNKNNTQFYKCYLSRLNLNISQSDMDKIIQELFFIYLIDNLIFDKSIKTNFDFDKSHFYQALKIINVK